MVRESYIKNKVVSILGNLAHRRQAKRLEADRASARIANLCSQEFDRASAEFERHMTRYIHETVKKELS